MTRAAPFGSYAPPQALRALTALTQRSFLRRGFFRHKIGGVIKLLRAAPLDMEFHGAKFRLYPQSSNIDLGLLLHADYNMKEIAFLRGQVPQGGVFVDIGANIGLYSILLSQPFGPAATVLCVEPNPAVLPRLSANLDFSKPRGVTIVAAAVGSEEGMVRFHSDTHSLGGSRVTQSGEIDVPVQTLLSMLRAHNIDSVDALKIDIEGYEDQALLPFFETAPRTLWPRSIVIEQTRGTRWQTSVLQKLSDLGYDTIGGTRSNAFLVLQGDHHG